MGTLGAAVAMVGAFQAFGSWADIPQALVVDEKGEHPIAVARRPCWRPIFGQQAAAIGHLRNVGVGPGDLFLLFGWFRSVEQHQIQWRYVRGSRPVHALWGWMHIGAVNACRSLPAA